MADDDKNCFTNFRNADNGWPTPDTTDEEKHKEIKKIADILNVV